MIGEELAQPKLHPTESTALRMREAQAAPWLSVERLLYGVAVVIGAWLRLWFVGQQPLSPWEFWLNWLRKLLLQNSVAALVVLEAETPQPLVVNKK